MPQERQVRDLARSYLKNRHVNAVKKIRILRVVRGREKDNPPFFRVSLKPLEYRVAKFKPPEHLVLGARPCCLLLISGLFRIRGNDVFGLPRLEFSRIGPRLYGCVYEFSRYGGISVMVDPRLCYHESRSEEHTSELHS